MTILQTLTILISFGLLSCNNNKTTTTIKNENMKVDSVTSDTILKPKQKNNVVISDTIKRLEVDDYPLTNKLFLSQSESNQYLELKSGTIISHDKAWFCNDTLNQILVFELYTDYHRLVTYHFYKNDIPIEIINRIELHTKVGDTATNKQKQNDFNGLVKQAISISSKYFTTEKGFRLGDTKQKAIDIYGSPDKKIVNNGIEKIEWEFIGDEFYDGKTNLNGKPLAKNSFGHSIAMYFKNGKLIGQILFNHIP